MNIIKIFSNIDKIIMLEEFTIINVDKIIDVILIVFFERLLFIYDPYVLIYAIFILAFSRFHEYFYIKFSLVDLL